MIRLAVAALALAAASCASPPPSTVPGVDECGAVAYQYLVGRPQSDVPANLPARARVITPDMMVTADYSATRLNILIGTDGKVGSVRCF